MLTIHSQVLGDYFESPEYQEAYQNYQLLGTNVTKKGNAFSERE